MLYNVLTFLSQSLFFNKVTEKFSINILKERDEFQTASGGKYKAVIACNAPKLFIFLRHSQWHTHGASSEAEDTNF